MPGFDDRLKTSLEQLAEPADPTGAFDGVVHKRAHRRIARRIQNAGLALVVLAGTAGGTYGLLRIFRSGTPTIPAAPSIENGHIAFQVSPLLEPFELYVVSPDETGLSNLTPDDADYYSPAWSPDGSRLAFLRIERRGQVFEQGIFVANVDGTGRQQVLSMRDSVSVSVPEIEWSPDGSKIAFLQLTYPSPGVEAQQLNVMDAGGGGLRSLTDPNQWVDSFSWSPDGSQIVFSVRSSFEGGRFPYDLFVMHADGTGVQRFTDDGRSKDPAWSPDGERIAFAGWEPGEDFPLTDIYVMDVDGTMRTRLTGTPGSEGLVTWSPDGSRLIFSRATGQEDLDCELVSMKADGTDERTIVRGQQLGGCPGPAAWQPVPASQGTAEPSPSIVIEPTTSPEPIETPSPSFEEMIAPACDISKVTGDYDGDGTADTALVYFGEAAEGCETAQGRQEYGLAVFWPFPEDPTIFSSFAQALPDCGDLGGCRAFGAVDFNGDGTDELVLQVGQGASTSILQFYELTRNETAKEPVGVKGGPEPLQLVWGGSVTHQDAIRCEEAGDGRLVVVTSAENYSEPNRYETWKVDETLYRFDGEAFTIVSTRHYTVPVDSEEAAILYAGADMCGSPVGGASP